MKLNLWTIVNIRDTKIFLGKQSLRNIPMLFSEYAQAHELLTENAQVMSDWRIAVVVCIVESGETTVQE